MAVFLVFNSLMLFPIHSQLLTHLSYYHLSAYQLQEAHLLFVAANCTIAAFLNQKQAIEYLGQANMLALTTVLVLLPMLAISSLTHSYVLVTPYLAIVTAFTIREYFRRMSYANIVFDHKAIVAINFCCLGAFLIYVFH